MTADWGLTPIDGVVRRLLPSHGDDRGYLRELWRASWSDGLAARFVQANISHSARGVLRGLHFHLRQADLWVVVGGRALVAAVDLRPRLGGGSETPSVLLELSAGEAIFIPERVAHGFLALEDLDLVYLVTNEYDGSDELGFAWDDPLAGLTWPTGEQPRLSHRDSTNPSLEEAIRTVVGR